MKKAIIILFALTALLIGLPAATLLAEGPTGVVSAGKTITTAMINYDGDDIGLEAYIEFDGERYPAYCIDPVLPGAAGHPNKEYEVKISGTNNLPKVATILHNSVPYVTKESMLEKFPGLSDIQIYAATKAAVRACAMQTEARYPDDNLWKGDAQTVAFAKYLIDLAKNHTEPLPEIAIYGTTGTTDVTPVGEWLVKTTTLQSSNYDLADGTKIRLTIPADAPVGTVITDMNDAPIPADGVPNRTQIKIKAPKSSVPAGATVKFDVAVEMRIASAVILFGVPTNPEDVGEYQRYEVAVPEQPSSFPVAFEYTAEPDAPTTPPTASPTASPADPPQIAASLLIKKIEAGTTKGLAGAIFRVTDADGGIVGDYITDAGGQISVALEDLGCYYVDEITPPAGYQLADDNHKDIVVTETEDAVLTFANKPAPRLEVVKIDADTGEKLPGVVIRAAYDGGHQSFDATTDASGIAAFANLWDGTWTITEVSTIAGYTLDLAPRQIKLEAGKLSSITLTNRKTPGIVIRKFDEDTGLPLAGAEFSVAQKGGSIVYEGITPKDGAIVVDGLEEGWYTVSEIAASTGYLKTWESKDIYLEPGKQVEVKFDNRLRPSLKLVKLDSQTNNPLEGAKFHVKKAEDATVSEFVTDASGAVTIYELDEAVYTAWEFEAPDGYLLDEQHKDIQLEWGKTKTLVFTNKARPALEILKLDEESGQPLAGAKFRVWKTEDNTTSEYVTDSAGRVLIQNLDEAIYSIEEIAAPSGYLLEPQRKEIQLEWGKTKTLVFTNKARPALEILKLDEESGQPLAGAKFHVWKTEDNTTSEYVTDAAGRVLIQNLDDAIYSIEEIVAPSGYLLEPQHKDIQLEWGKTKTLVFTNKARPKLKILKIDAITGQPLTGAEFRVTKVEDSAVSEYITDETGTILIENLDESIYRVEEFMAPDGYLLYTESKEIQLEWGKTKVLKFDDVRKPTLIVTKINALTYQPVPDATYKIEYEGSDGGVIPLGTYRTDANGQIIIPKVNTGWYIITETIPAPGFSLPSDPVTRKYLAPGENAYTSFGSGLYGEAGDVSGFNVQITSGADYAAAGQEIVNYPLNSIIIRKVHAVTGELLAGAAFEVRKVTEDVSGGSGTIIGRYTTDNSGVVVVSGLQPGGYIVTEVQAPNNFLISENSQQQAWLKPDGTSIVEVTFANYPYGSLLVSKVDAETGAPLSGARFRVTDGSGAAAGNSNGVPAQTQFAWGGSGEYSTDEAGQFLIGGLKPGSYIVSEIEAPPNYVIDTTPQTVNIGTDGKVYAVSFKNQPFGSLLITKVDARTGAPLSGTRFKVVDSDGTAAGNANGEYTTNAGGEILIPNLRPGAYVAAEMEAPPFYAVDTTPQTIAVRADGRIYKLSFQNQPYGTLVIKKLDFVTHAPLSGAEFKVTTSAGGVVGGMNGLYVTDAAGTIEIPHLPKDSYVVEEVTAPDGYILENQARTIAVDYGGAYTLDFYNKPKSGLQVLKIDADTKDPLKDARFTVYRKNGEILGEYVTDGDGLIIIDNLDAGWYKVVETKSPSGYQIDETARDVEAKYNQFIKVTFENRKLTSLVVKKTDDKSGAPLAGAVFRVEKQNGLYIGEYTTDHDGLINLPALDPDWYIAREVRSPDGYLLDETPKLVEVKTVTPTVITVTNKKLTALQIRKVDEQSGKPLPGATFAVERQDGLRVDEYVTDDAGFINIPTLDPGWYVIRETKSPSGYILDQTPQSVEVKTSAPTVVTFTNKKMTALEIIKIDERTGEPLNGAVFVVERQNGERIGEFTTNERGIISIPNLAPDWYLVKEIKSPQGYILSETPKTVEVKTFTPSTVKFTNQKKSGMQIIKTDAATGTPLPGAVFTVYRQSGEVIGEFTTDANGVIILDNLDSGWYKAAETKAPSGYLISEAPKDVEVTHDQFIRVVFADERLAALQIKKVDATTGAALAGAVFTVAKQNGERVGDTYVTDASGFANIPNLAPDFYVVSEVKAPDGYLLDSAPQTVQVKPGVPAAVTFSDKAVAGIQIIKTNSVTKGGIPGVQFTVTKINGERVGTFTTGKDGAVFVPNLEPGDYTVTETAAATGYILDSAPRIVTVTWGESARLEVENTPASGLLIVKTDESTGKPLAGVKFDIRRYDGSIVSGGLINQNQPNTPYNSPNRTTTANGDINGNYTTDANGRILLNDIPFGRYMVIETDALPGYELDTAVHDVTVMPGQQAALRLTNRQKAGLRVIKVDSVTKAPIFGTEFMVFDANGNVVGRFITDDNGVIDFSDILSEGRYSIRETKAAPGYYLDDQPKTIEFVSGKMTELYWENVPQMGQIQITKRSADDNEVNGLPAGSPLADAVFEVYAYKTGNLVDRFISGADGRAVSKPLPLGRFLIKEVQAPQWYKLSDKTLDIKIEYAGQILKLEYLNYSANTGVSIRKTGPVEAMPGDTIRYDLKEIRNTSTVSLTDFYWRDILPSGAVRLTKIVTGTYNQSLRYKVMITTNKGDTRIIADNLGATRNNVIDCSNASLGLYSDEYVTSFTLLFGTVKAGFSMVEPPQVYAKVQPGLKNGAQFANKVDVGGKYGKEWVISNSAWMTTIYSPVPAGKLPRTGY
ncbi:MAG: Cys-Gln thioester bond-forming surface protein [Clostridiales bacterium]|nr:Cys-Gln thioester bond-forming surface protein [Clostridiales bacterium]